MLFHSPIFLFAFLPLVLGAYFLSPRGARNLLLLLASAVFYYWGSGELVVLLVASIAFNYAAGFALEWASGRDNNTRRLVLAAAVAANLGLLGFYKYANFLTTEFGELAASMGYAWSTHTNIPLPIGISFFTFQAMSYVMDVGWGRVKAQRGLVDFALYISLFPQLVAGPIVRYIDIAQQLKDRSENVPEFLAGAKRFMLGLGRKVLIADAIGIFVDSAMKADAATLGPGAAWLGAAAFGLQIYYDFSAYSDMAIGLGCMFGFRFLENFDHPYMSRSITEFWRRWHLSLSTWFRDYLYIPLGGNRLGTTRTYINLFTVFVLCGLWHGASWTFLVWGLFHGAFLVAERAGGRHLLARLPEPICRAYALAVLTVSWVFFRATDMAHAWAYLKAMFMLNPAPATVAASSLLTVESGIALALGALLCFPLKSYLDGLAWTRQAAHRQPLWDEALRAAGTFVVFALAVAMLSTSTFEPFIYFRF